MHRYKIGQRLTQDETQRTIERLEAYRREWGDYEEFGDDAHKVQRVVDSLTAFIAQHQALPDTTSLTEAESDALLLM